MLFNSNVFLFLFLPTVVVGFVVLTRSRAGFAIGWLAVASLFFYGWWNPAYVPLLLASVVVNYALGRAAQDAPSRSRARLYAGVGIVLDLACIAWFKYAAFAVWSAGRVSGAGWEMAPLALPLAISFFTFQQIAFLADSARGAARETSFLRYCLFVTFFPQLISGPIVHHSEMMPQFAGRLRFDWLHFDVGLTLFALGLFKKAVIADGIGGHASPIYDAAARGVSLTLLEGWTAGLGYSLQLYFDFSGYSDMAVGLARIFGIRLPLNFHSPYKAESMIEFWRRWHMTLSRFLRDYVYIALGGGRRGAPRRYTNLLVTMLLGGLWHGAAWTFVLWGGLHGLFLCVNHGWRALKRAAGRERVLPPRLGRPLAVAATFLLTMLAFVLFRAESLEVTGAVLGSMAGLQGAVLSPGWEGVTGVLDGLSFVEWRTGPGATRLLGVETAAWLAFGLLVVFGLPNSQQLLCRYAPGLDLYGHLAAAEEPRLRWAPTLPWALATGALLVASVLRMMVEGNVEFLYRFF